MSAFSSLLLQEGKRERTRRINVVPQGTVHVLIQRPVPAVAAIAHAYRADSYASSPCTPAIAAHFGSDDYGDEDEANDAIRHVRRIAGDRYAPIPSNPACAVRFLRGHRVRNRTSRRSRARPWSREVRRKLWVKAWAKCTHVHLPIKSIFINTVAVLQRHGGISYTLHKMENTPS